MRPHTILPDRELVATSLEALQWCVSALLPILGSRRLVPTLRTILLEVLG